MPSTANTVAPMSSAHHHGHQPDGAEADDADEIGGLRLAADDRVVCGRQVVGEKDGGLVRHGLGERREHRVGVGNADELCLGAIEAGIDARVAEERAAGALRDAARAAGGARAVGDEAHVHHAVAGPDRRDIGADLDDLARELVPHDRPVLEARNVPVQRTEVGAADGRGVDADDRVGRGEEDWIGDVLDPDVVRARGGRRPSRRLLDLHEVAVRVDAEEAAAAPRRLVGLGQEAGSLAFELCSTSPVRLSTSTTSTTLALLGSSGAVIVTPGRSSAGCPCSASESRVPASVSVA